MAGRHVPDDFKRWQNELLFQTLEKEKEKQKNSPLIWQRGD